MHVFLLLFIVILGIIGLENPKVLANLSKNLGTARGIILNIMYLLPFVMVFFNVDSLSKWINNKTSNNLNLDRAYNKSHSHWSKDPQARKKYKAKQLRKVSESTKKVVASNQKWRCFMCHNLLDYSYEIDHNTPLFLGGTNHISNLHALCRNCHGKKTIMEKINNNI